jgi:hypothetical protein
VARRENTAGKGETVVAPSILTDEVHAAVSAQLASLVTELAPQRVLVPAPTTDTYSLKLNS